jgi:murein L,D-transpeptidase YafK
MIMKNLLTSLLALVIAFSATAQTGSTRGLSTYASFIDYQRTLSRPAEALKRKEDTLQKQFEAKQLQWPAKYIYIRSFKYDSQMEVWVKNDVKDQFKLFKTYRVCALAGTLGPKRMEGDYQVPEGFYYINEFNPNSSYYLSLGINYPNLSDRILSDSMRPGSAIYIHGSCVTVGCIPITDQQIDELYILAAHARNQGQDFIPVHIFPVRYNVKKSVAFLDNLTKEDPELKKFADRLEQAFDYFDKFHQIPVIMIGEKGEYIVNGAIPKKQAGDDKVVKAPRVAVQHRTRTITDLPSSVHTWPDYPGGAPAFAKYLDQLGKDMVNYLPTGTRKIFVQVEFIVDKDGVPVNIKILKGSTDEDFNDELIKRLETMGTWQPALLHDKPVAKKMIQTITVESPAQ